MSRFIILSCLILLALTKASLSPVFAISSDPSYLHSYSESPLL